MTSSDLRRVEKKVLELVGKEREPISTTELLGKQSGQRLAPDALRRAVWSLVGEGKLAYTDDRRLYVAQASDERRVGA